MFTKNIETSEGRGTIIIYTISTLQAEQLNILTECLFIDVKLKNKTTTIWMCV